MPIKFTGRHYEIPESLKSYAEKRLKKLERMLDEVLEVEVICSMEKYRHKAEVLVKSRNLSLRASETTNDMFTSLNSVFDILENQARKEKERLVKRKRQEKEVVTMPSTEVSEPEEPVLIYSDEYADKPLTVEEAMEELEKFDKEILVYRNAKNNKVNVLYKKGNRFYLIEPEW